MRNAALFFPSPTRFLLTSILLAFTALSLQAQEVTAAMNGIVTDPSGAAIAGAKVTAKDLDRGTTFPTTTAGDGAYSLPRLPIGRYELRVENAGFQSAVKSDVTLVLNQVAQIDFQLQVGNVNQTVEVTTAAPLLQTQSTQLGTVIDSRTNAQLPLATRNYNQLTLLAPGSVSTNPASFQGAQSTFGSGRPEVNGNREQANFYLLDGIDNNQISENDVGYSPNVDAIEEFNLITNNASAEFGNFMGGIISVSLKSGTNQFHGTAFEFIRNDKLNANTWSNNWNGQPRSLLRWNEFGGTFGGPIFKDKLFFFGDYQGSRFDQPATATPITTLTNAERTGDFSANCTAGFTNGICNNPAQQIYNPFTGSNGANRQPFLNNKILPGFLNPIAVQIVSSSLFPATINNNLTQNALNTTHTYTNSDQGDLKIDWNPTNKDHTFGRFTRALTVNPNTNSQALLYSAYNNFPLYNGVLDWTRTISPSIVNDARGGVQYYPVTTGFNPAGSSGLPSIPGANSNFLPGFFFAGGNINTGSSSAGASGPAFGTAAVTQVFSDTNIQAEDTLIITKGTHTMRAGFQFFRQRLNIFYSGNEGLGGDFNFNGQYTQNVVNGTPVGGLPEADFMLGFPFNLGIGAGAGTVGQRANIYSTFFQDDWRVNEHLTLNLGLRWELHTPWDEVHNRQTNFQEFTGQVLLSGQTSLFNDNNALYNQYNGITNFQPRIGLAWTPFGSNTVIRASYSLSSFLEGTGTNLRLFRNPPWELGHSTTYNPAANGGFPPTTLSNGFNFTTSGTPCTPQTITSYPASCFAGATIFTWDPNDRPAVSNQWNFTIQHQFGNSTTFQVAYVGQKNTHLMVPVNASQGLLVAPGVVRPSPYLAGNPALLAEAPTDKLTNTTGIQSYNALQVVLQRRLANGLELQANYTWSKCLTDSLGYYGLYANAANGADQSGGNYFYYQNTYNAHADYGPCFYDVTHLVSGFVTYDLPFGRNRTFGKSVNGVVNAVLGDWQINSIFTFHSGFPFTISAPDQSGTGSFDSRANCIAPPIVFGEQNSPLGGYQWFSQASYAPETQGSFGTCGVGTVRGPGLHTVDLSLSKRFFVTEHQNLEFRAEAINFTNTPILAGPGSSQNSATTLGRITNSQGARNIQFGLKYNF